MSDNIQPAPQSVPSTLSLHDDYEAQRARMRATEKMIWFITVVAGVISMIIIISVAIIAIAQIVIGNTTPERLVMPDVLVNWGGIILGFYFGQFATLLKDFMGSVPVPRAKGPSRP